MVPIGTTILMILHLHGYTLRAAAVSSFVEGMGVEDVDTWDADVVHIVNTRFMQHQASLPTLGRARFLLFAHFCFPSMVHQSSQKFLWIVRTDPNLDEKLRDDMVELLRPHSNFFLVASNNNFLAGNGSLEGAWRDGIASAEVLRSSIYCGDVRLLRAARKFENEKIVLETRLDADDGLHVDYLKYVQESAVEKLQSHDTISLNKPLKASWHYWCARRHIQWHVDENGVGELNKVEHSHFCITAGLTIGFAHGTSAGSVKLYPHDTLFKQVQKDGGCGTESNEGCIELVSDIDIAAMRSRTVTSAGMMGVTLEGKIDRNRWKDFWEKLETGFKISLKEAKLVNSFILKNLEAIALENEMGQCTEGHSCKTKSKEKLLRMRDLAKYGAKLTPVVK